MSPSNIIGTYVLGAIFVIGGAIFMALLDHNQLLFGIPYLLIGLFLVYGAHGASKRRKRQLAKEAAETPPGSGPSAQ
jgi:threonine/homoserine/homoserine lactone efflux protein